MKRPNILLLVIDCLRADHAYDRSLSRTPSLGSLVNEGFSFTSAVSASSYTPPSFASILTGLNPPEHGIHRIHGDRLNPAAATLAERLSEAGYNTYAEVSGPLFAELGLDRGFRTYTYRDKTATLRTPWGDELLQKLRSRYQPPWFLLLHIWDLHRRRQIRPECRGRDSGATEYARALSSIDIYLHRLVESLPEDTLLVLAGDHGEDFATGPLDRLLRYAGMKLLRSKACHWARRRRLVRRPYSQQSRGWMDDHGYNLYDLLVRVPLVFHWNGCIAPGSSGIQVRHVDICPTILDLAGAPMPPGLSGSSLAEVIAGKPGCGRDAYLEFQGGLRRRGDHLWGLRVENRYKYLFCGPDYGPELYDLEHDPGEARNIAGEHPDLVAELHAKLEACRSREVEPTRMTEEQDALVRERLRRLGY